MLKSKGNYFLWKLKYLVLLVSCFFHLVRCCCCICSWFLEEKINKNKIEAEKLKKDERQIFSSSFSYLFFNFTLHQTGETFHCCHENDGMSLLFCLPLFFQSDAGNLSFSVIFWSYPGSLKNKNWWVFGEFHGWSFKNSVKFPKSSFPHLLVNWKFHMISRRTWKVIFSYIWLIIYT